MFYFSYQFFFSSFSSKFLKKYSNLLGFHMLSRYNLIIVNYLYLNLYQFLLSRLFFLAHFTRTLQVNYTLRMKLFYIFIYFVNLLQIYNFKDNHDRFIKIKGILSIYCSLIIKYLFMLRNYIQCLLNNYFYTKLLNNVSQYKNKFIVCNKQLVALPSVTRMITLLKSPHIHKKARDQYFFSVHKIGFLFKNLLTFYPKTFYLNFLNNLNIRLERMVHFYN